nr:MAG TPA: hypothetical protein [Bacteriophage sp.]
MGEDAPLTGARQGGKGHRASARSKNFCDEETKYQKQSE